LRKLLSVPPVEEKGAWVTFMDALAEGQKLLPDNHVLGEPAHLFTRIEDDWIQAQINKLHGDQKVTSESSSTVTTEKPGKSNISYDDCAKLDIRTAMIVAAEAVPKADKLLKLLLDVNGVQRTVVSGIAQHYKPEDLPGRNVVILANLEVRKIK